MADFTLIRFLMQSNGVTPNLCTTGIEIYIDIGFLLSFASITQVTNFDLRFIQVKHQCMDTGKPCRIVLQMQRKCR